MENITALRRHKKDDLIANLMAVTKANNELNEKLAASAVIGGAAGFLLGLAIATL